MQGSAEGVSLNDIRSEFGVSRKTAERLRDAVIRVFPQTEEGESDGRKKRWRIPSRVLNSLVAVSAEDLAEMEAAAALLRRENRRKEADRLLGLSGRLKALIKPETVRRIATDLEALVEAEGLAWRPGPFPKIDPDVMDSLRKAILSCHKVVVHYVARSSGKYSYQTVHPYGFLYGSRHYLVAYSPGAVKDMGSKDGIRLFSLPNIKKVEITKEPFVRDGKFSLRKYADQSFGVFHDKPVHVVWRFSKDAAADAREFQFHPTQKTRTLKDGSLEVSFRAEGLLEMCWHLFTWGDSVEVIKPAALKKLFSEQIALCGRRGKNA
jgi:predicted DNA-binding transcriptional regulator YafY